MSEPSLGTLGRYRLLRRLGRGGMAEVFEGRAEGAAGVTKPVCVKRILPSYARDRRFVRMFVAEARVSMALDHGNIAQVFDFGQEGGDLYLAMELVDGRSLWDVRRRLEKDGYRFPVPLALQVVGEVCKALHHAHTCTDERGAPLRIVHRDVSPQNVLLSYEGQVKLVDFGIARAASVAEEGGGVKGKLPYMAPEQAKGEEVDRRADVFGAGAMLFELLTGRTPLEGSTPSILHRLDTGEIPSLSEVAPRIDPALAAIVDRALAVDPAERFSSALAFQEALAQYAQHSGQRAGEDEVGMLVRHVFARQLVEAGRTVDLSAAFAAALETWRIGDEGEVVRRPVRFLLALVLPVLLFAGVGLGLWYARASAPTWDVTVRSIPPGARILIDGEETGVTTDGTLRGLDPSRVHQLTFVLPGFERKSRTLLPGEETVSVRLSRPRVAGPTPERPAADGPDDAPPGREPIPPVREVRTPGRIEVELDQAALTVTPRRLPSRAFELDPAAAHRLEVAGEIRMSLARDATTQAWVAFEPDGGIRAQGLVRPGRPARVPAGSDRLVVYFPEASNCGNNSGSVTVVVRRDDRPVHRFQLDVIQDCLAVYDLLRVRVGDLESGRASRVRYVGPDDGPPVLLTTTSTHPLSLSRPFEEGTEMLRPGETVVMRHIGTLYPGIVQARPAEEAPPIRLVLEVEDPEPIEGGPPEIDLGGLFGR